MGSLLPIFSPPTATAGGVALRLKLDHVGPHLTSQWSPAVYEIRSTFFNLTEETLLPTFLDSSPNISQLTVFAPVTVNIDKDCLGALGDTVPST